LNHTIFFDYCLWRFYKKSIQQVEENGRGENIKLYRRQIPRPFAFEVGFGEETGFGEEEFGRGKELAVKVGEHVHEFPQQVANLQHRFAIGLATILTIPALHLSAAV
jgi:hypothetical protein